MMQRFHNPHEQLHYHLIGNDSKYIPASLFSLVKYCELDSQVTEYQHDAARLGWLSPDVVDELESEIDMSLETRAGRRNMELALADRIQWAADLNHMHYHKLAESMRSCRQNGVVGYVPGREGYQVAWQSKCGNVRCCPDEAREEAKRVEKKYKSTIEEWVSVSRLRSVQYGVFTTENFPRGSLADGKKKLFGKFKYFIKKFPQVKGVLITEEDPLSRSRDWNIHLNVLLMVEGHIDWKQVRSEWKSNVHLQLVKRENIGNSIRELIKYAAKYTGHDCIEYDSQSDTDLLGSECNQDKNSPPGLLDYSPDELREWLDAQRSFRRTRAYGVLFAVHRKRWDAVNCSDSDRRAIRLEFFRAAASREVLPWSVLERDWCALEEKEKRVLRRAMDEGVCLSSAVVWIGRLKYEFGWGKNYEGGSYRVDLIPGDKSPVSFGKNNNFSGLSPGSFQ